MVNKCPSKTWMKEFRGKLITLACKRLKFALLNLNIGISKGIPVDNR